jgi:integrase/recombinase XerD
MAHKKGLDGVYFKPTREDCFREFRKTIPQLTLSESERLKLEVSNLTENNDSMVKQYEDRISKTESLLKKVLERLDSS